MKSVGGGASVNRLARAAAEMRAALLEERERIDRALKDLDAWESVGASPEPEAPPAKATVRRDPEPKAAKPHGVPGKPGVVVGEKKGQHDCPGCGREGLAKSQGPGGWMALHRAPCGLFCAASNTDRLSAEDRADGVHSKRNCPKCKAPREATG